MAARVRTRLLSGREVGNRGRGRNRRSQRRRFATTRGLLTLAVAAALAACGDSNDDETPPPDTAPPDTRAPRAVIDAVLARAHGPHRGSFDSVIVEVRESADGPATTFSVDLPDRIRRNGPDGRIAVFDGEQAWAWQGAGAAEFADRATRTELETWLAVLDLVCLQPFVRADRFERVGPHRIAALTAAARHELAYQPSTDAPQSLQGPAGSIEILELYDSGTTRIPVVVRIEGVGQRHLRFWETGVEHAPDAFAPPAGETRETFVVGAPAPSTAARIETTPAVEWLMTPDPAAWPQRMAWLRDAGGRLGARGYGNGGDPFFVTIDGEEWFVVPFRPVRSDPEPVTPKEGERVVRVASGRAVVVDASPGEFEARVDAAGTQVATFLREQGLEPDGPRRVTVNVIGRDLENDPRALHDAPVRVIRPIAR